MRKQFDFADISLRIKSHSFGEHIRYRLPTFHKILVKFFIRRRIFIYRSLKPDSHFTAWFYWLITGSHIAKNGYSLSNYGVWLAKRPEDITFNLCLDASYMNGLEKILRDIKQGTTFLDIGANIGVFSLVAELNPNIVAIHAFEPDLETYKFLEKNVSRSRSNRIFMHNHAIGKNKGQALLTKHAGHSGISRIENNSNDNSGTHSIITMINHNYLNTIFKKDSGTYFIKIDVEGYEFEVLETLAIANLFPNIQAFFVEFDQNMGKVQQVEDFLKENNFTESSRWGSGLHWDALWTR